LNILKFTGASLRAHRFIPWLLSAALLAFLAVSSPSPAAGPSLELEKHAGKVVYVDFWASWCIPCKKSFPWMWSMAQKYGSKGFVVLTVNLDKDETLIQQFLADFPPMDLAVIRDPAGALATEWKVETMPTSFIVDKKGKVRFTHKGFRTNEIPDYESHIAELVNQ